MTPSEFKAWFEGFTEAFDKVPTRAQWERVKARVGEIDGKPVTERVYVDRYWRDYWNMGYSHPGYWRNYPFYSSTSIGTVSQNAVAQSNSHSASCSGVGTFNSSDAMYALGKADAQSLT